MLIKILKKSCESLCPTSFRKCPTEYYFFRTLCSTGFEKLFAALIEKPEDFTG